MKERRRQEEERDRAGVLDEEIDPPVGRWPQPANEEQQEKNAHDEEHPDGPVVRALPEHEQTDREKEKPDDRFVEVRGVGENPARQRHVRDEHMILAALDHIRDPRADSGLQELAPRVGRAPHDSMVDAEDPVPGEDPGSLGAGAPENLPDEDGILAVGVRDDSVGRPSDEHVGDRAQGDCQTHEAEDQESSAGPKVHQTE